jgi:hypothetical protein
MDRKIFKENSVACCETVLREEISYNDKHAILPSENRISALLLRRSAEMREVYEEICSKLDPAAVKEFLKSVLYTGAFWDPESNEDARNQKRRLEETNALIAEVADELAALIDERESIHNSSSFGSDTHYHVCEVLDAAADTNGLFNSWVKEELRCIRMKYDLKYWPSIGAFVRELGADAANAPVSAADSLTEAGTSSQRASLADYFRALFASIDECSYHNRGPYPRGFSISDKSVAAIGNCALGLSAEALVDSQYVKRLRQRMRKQQGAAKGDIPS